MRLRPERHLGPSRSREARARPFGGWAGAPPPCRWSLTVNGGALRHARRRWMKRLVEIGRRSGKAAERAASLPLRMLWGGAAGQDQQRMHATYTRCIRACRPAQTRRHTYVTYRERCTRAQGNSALHHRYHVAIHIQHGACRMPHANTNTNTNTNINTNTNTRQHDTSQYRTTHHNTIQRNQVQLPTGMYAYLHT